MLCFNFLFFWWRNPLTRLRQQQLQSSSSVGSPRGPFPPGAAPGQVCTSTSSGLGSGGDLGVDPGTWSRVSSGVGSDTDSGVNCLNYPPPLSWRNPGALPWWTFRWSIAESRLEGIPGDIPRDTQKSLRQGRFRNNPFWRFQAHRTSLEKLLGLHKLPRKRAFPILGGLGSSVVVARKMLFQREAGASWPRAGSLIPRSSLGRKAGCVPWPPSRTAKVPAPKLQQPPLSPHCPPAPALHVSKALPLSPLFQLLPELPSPPGWAWTALQTAGMREAAPGRRRGMSPATVPAPPARAGGSEMLQSAGDRSRWIHPCHWEATAGMSQLTFILQGTLSGDRTPPPRLGKV